MRSNKVRLVLMVLLISFVLTSISEPIFLSTAIADSNSNPLGLMAYIETGKHIDLDNAKGLFKTISLDEPDRIVGTYSYYINNYNREDINMLITDNGVIAVGYLDRDPAGRVISWGSDKILYNNFMSAIGAIGKSLAINIDVNDIIYYHAKYPDANRILYATQSVGESFIQSYSYGSLKFNIPSDATIYEVSYSLYLSDPYNYGMQTAIDTVPMASTMNNGVYYGFYNGYIQKGIDHLLGIMSGQSAKAGVTMIIIYKDDNNSQSIMVQNADSYTDKVLAYPKTNPSGPSSNPTAYPTTYEPTYYPTVTPIIAVPMPTAVSATISPTEENPSDLSVWITSEKTDNVALDEDAILKLSAVSLITKPKMMVQVIIMVPSGVSVTASDFSQSGTNQYTSKYELQPGDNKHVEVKIRANQPGTFVVKGRIVYYFGEDKSTGKEYTKDVTINVVPGSSPTPIYSPTPTYRTTPKAEPGFEIIPGIGILIILLCFKKMR